MWQVMPVRRPRRPRRPVEHHHHADHRPPDHGTGTADHHHADHGTGTADHHHADHGTGTADHHHADHRPPTGSTTSWWVPALGNQPWQWEIDHPLDLSNATDMGTGDTLPDGSPAPPR